MAPFRSMLFLTSTLALAGCGLFTAETRHPGGVVGAAADRAVFPAASKPMQAYRGLVVGTALARMAERNAVTSAAAVTAVNALNGVSSTTGRLYELGNKPCYTDSQAAGSWPTALPDGKVADPTHCYRNAYSVLFEAKLPDLHEALYYLASASLPPERFGDLASSLTSGNYLGALWSFLLAARDTAATLHYGLSVGRSATEQRAIVADSRLPKAELFDLAVATQVLGVEAESLKAADGKPDRTAFYAMFSLMKESCFRIQRRIASTGGPSEVKCRETFGDQKAAYNEGLNPPD